MTTKEQLIWKLQSCCIPDTMIDEVIKHCVEEINKISDDLADCYHITWDRPESEYGTGFHSLLWMQAKPIVLKWLNEHHPQAWFKSLFDDNEMKKIIEEQNKKYWFMIEHGLGVEDITPPTYPHP
jgi:hypothetical protein